LYISGWERRAQISTTLDATPATGLNYSESQLARCLPVVYAEDTTATKAKTSKADYSPERQEGDAVSGLTTLSRSNAPWQRWMPTCKAGGGDRRQRHGPVEGRGDAGTALGHCTTSAQLRVPLGDNKNLCLPETVYRSSRERRKYTLNPTYFIQYIEINSQIYMEMCFMQISGGTLSQKTFVYTYIYTYKCHIVFKHEVYQMITSFTLLDKQNPLLGKSE